MLSYLQMSQPANNENLLTPDEVKKIWAAKKSANSEGLDKIDISKLDKDHQTFLKYALNREDFDLVKICLQCKNAAVVLNDLIVEENFQLRYVVYLFSQKDPLVFENALAILNQCSNAKNVIRFFHDSMFTIKNMPFIHYAISIHHYGLLKIILQSETVEDILTCKFENQTPLEYATRQKNHEACRLILDELSKNNPFAQVILTSADPYPKLKKMLDEAKLQDKTTQQQLHVAGICCLILGKSWIIDELLFEKGMSYPHSPYYCKPSFLDHILSTKFENKQLQINLVKKCLAAIERDPVIKEIALKDSANQNNLLALAYKTEDADIIRLLREAGATLPDEPISRKKENILIQSIEENKIEFFKSNLDTTQDKLIEAAQYCIQNYDEKNTYPENNLKMITFLDTLLRQKAKMLSENESETLSDFALKLNKIPLISLLEQHGIYYSNNKPIEKEKTPITPIDLLSQYVLSGRIDSLKTYLSRQPEEEQRKVLNNRSSQGLTLAELAIVYNQNDIFAYLVNHPEFRVGEHAIFDILEPNQINELRNIKKYKTQQYVKFQSTLDNAYKDYPTDYKKPSIEPHIESKTLESNTLKKLVFAIVAEGNIEELTLKNLAKMGGFKHKVAKYLERLEKKGLAQREKVPEAILEIDALFTCDNKKNLIPQFFGVPRGFRGTSTGRGTLEINKRLYAKYLSRLGPKKPEKKEEEITPSAPPEYLENPPPYAPYMPFPPVEGASNPVFVSNPPLQQSQLPLFNPSSLYPAFVSPHEQKVIPPIEKKTSEPISVVAMPCNLASQRPISPALMPPSSAPTHFFLPKSNVEEKPIAPPNASKVPKITPPLEGLPKKPRQLVMCG